MTKLNEFMQWRTVSGNPVTAREVTVIPQVQTLTIRWPGGGWVWNRPAAVMVESEGQVARLPIVDVTRLVQVGILLAGLVFIIMMSIYNRKERTK